MSETGPALVTGGTGFLGRHVVRELRARGVPVRVLVRDRPARPPAIRHELAAQGSQLVSGDVLDEASLRPALEGVRTVYHLAGRLFSPGVPEEEYRRLHVDGTRNVLDACAVTAGIRAVVHCSTTGVLGPTGERPAAENAPSRPSNAYERTKAEGERLALDLAARHGWSLVVARPALVYGPGDLHLLGWFRAIRRGYYRVVGRGDNPLHPIYVDDCIEGLLRCAEMPAAAGRAYNLVGERAVPIREMASAIGRAVGRPLSDRHIPVPLAKAVAAALEAIPGLPPARLPLTRSRVAFMTQSRAYCGCRARAELGFVPRMGLEDGLRRTVAWYRAEGLL